MYYICGKLNCAMCIMYSDPCMLEFVQCTMYVPQRGILYGYLDTNTAPDLTSGGLKHANGSPGVGTGVGDQVGAAVGTCVGWPGGDGVGRDLSSIWWYTLMMLSEEALLVLVLTLALALALVLLFSLEEHSLATA